MGGIRREAYDNNKNGIIEGGRAVGAFGGVY